MLVVDIDNIFSVLCVIIDNDVIWVVGINGNVVRIEVVYNWWLNVFVFILIMYVKWFYICDFYFMIVF